MAKVLAAEGYIVSKQTVWSHLPRSGRRFKLTPDILAIIEEQLRVDDETTATQLVKIVNAVGYDVSKSTIVRVQRILANY